MPYQRNLWNQLLNRRDFLHLSATTMALGATTWATGCTNDGSAQSQNPPSYTQPPDVELNLRATVSTTAVLAGSPTQVHTFQGELVQGDSNTLQAMPNSYLGPIIRVRRGQRVRVNCTNALNAATIVHWHGLHVPDVADGHPRFAIGPGETYVYDFTVQNRAGTYWFHPHPHGQTGPQVYAGLAGLFLVSDEEESALNLPTGAADIPLIIQDRTFDNTNQMVYLPNGMMDRMRSMLGERILVNGQPDYTLSVATRPYRLRLLNGSNARIYRLAWEDGTPLTLLASDGGLLARPVQRDSVVLAPGERVEVWADVRGRTVGETLRLRSLPMEGLDMAGGMMGGGRGGMMGGRTATAPPNGAEVPILTVRVAQETQDDTTLPSELSIPGFLNPADAVNQQNPRSFTASMGRMQWFLNGRTFEMEAVAQNEIVALGTTEIWEFINQENQHGMMGMMGMAHPIHVHGLQFQIIERIPPSNATHQAHWEAVQAGLVNEGWKDTFLLMPGERVRILLRFADYAGLYLYHCHNLEHEDSGMMRNYRVQASTGT